jgi:hypothetical protein
MPPRQLTRPHGPADAAPTPPDLLLLWDAHPRPDAGGHAALRKALRAAERRAVGAETELAGSRREGRRMALALKQAEPRLRKLQVGGR